MAIPPHLSKLLSMSTAATAPGERAPVQPMDAERRKWLEEAWGSICTDPVKKMKEHITILANELTPADELADVLDQLLADVGQIDMACDLHKIGGFDVVLRMAQHEDEEVRANAHSVIATCLQHNEYMQQQYINMCGLEPLFRQITEEQSTLVHPRALFTLSSLLRHCPAAQKKFREIDGMDTILFPLLQHNQAKIRIRIHFLIYSLVAEWAEKGAETLEHYGAHKIIKQLEGSLNQEQKRENKEVDVVERIKETLQLLRLNNFQNSIQA